MNEKISENIEDQENQKPDMETMAAKYGQKFIESDCNLAFDVKKFELTGEKYDTEDVHFFLDILIKFANSPMITDEFKDHRERRQFRKEIFNTDPEYYAIVETNKLRRNHISAVEAIFPILEEYINDSNMAEETKKGIKQLCDEFPRHDLSTHDLMSNEEKIDHVKKIDAIITKLFDILKTTQEKTIS